MKLGDNNNINEIIITNEKVEEVLIEENWKYFSKVLESEVCRSDIYKNLNKDNIRDKILNRELTI